MAIRPVDMQVMIHRMAEINRATNNDGSRAENQNQAFAQSLQKAVEQDGRQVVNANQTEKSDVDKDGRKGDRGRRRRRDGKNPEDEEKGNDAAKGKRNMLDITI